MSNIVKAVSIICVTVLIMSVLYFNEIIRFKNNKAPKLRGFIYLINYFS